ncbi:MAG: branched-chain amino acid ABC transporter permease [Geobacter sp.]|nr:branched-chain amino acid ABC transporter permease [Geobacter sp.]
MTFEIFISQFFGGLSVAMLLFLVASGLTLIFGVAKVFNFAHGSFYMLGAYFSYQAISMFENFWIGAVAAALGAGLVGMLLEICFIRRIAGREEEGAFQILLTYAFILILDDAVKYIWGPAYKTISKPDSLAGSLDFGQVTIPTFNLFIIVLGLVIVVAAWYVLSRTKTGKIIQAASTDTQMVGMLGVNVSLVMSLVFGVATAMGGLAGAMAAPLRTVAPGSGVEVIIDSLIVVVIGGLGNFWGALFAALLIGEVNAFGILWMPQWASLLSFAVMIVVLIFKPKGLFSREKGRKKI